MKFLKAVTVANVKSLWINHYYDVPLSGLCEEAGKLAYFEIDDPYKLELVYFIYVLSFLERIKWKLNWFLFELLVGSHWTTTYNGRYRSSGRDYSKQPWHFFAALYYFLDDKLFQYETPNH